MIAEQIKAAWMWGQDGGPCQPLSPPAVWGCPLNLPLHGVAMGNTWFTPGLHLASTLLVGFFGTFGAQSGFHLQLGVPWEDQAGEQRCCELRGDAG